MSDIDRIMYLIHWNRTEQEQQEGIAMAGEISCIKGFFQPLGPGCGKPVWGNCAEIICRRSDEELNPYVMDMLLWLEDLNWPGAEKIHRRLIGFRDVSWLSVHLNKMVPALSYLGEEAWLQFLADLLDNQKLKDALCPKALEILRSHQWNDEEKDLK